MRNGFASQSNCVRCRVAPNRSAATNLTTDESCATIVDDGKWKGSSPGCTTSAASSRERTIVLFHTWTVTRELLAQAIREKQSMDLDVCVDDSGNAYLGHPKEYHDKTHEPFFNSIPLWKAVEALSRSDIPVIVDCEHVNAWPVVENIVTQLRPERCLVHSFVSELKFDAGRADDEPDFISEWSSIATLRELKRQFPSVTTTASAKWLPADAPTSDKYGTVLAQIVSLLKQNRVDTICLKCQIPHFRTEPWRGFCERAFLLTWVSITPT